LDAGAYIGPAVHLHQTVRAIAGNTEEAAWAMVLEAACEDPHSRGIEGGRDALPHEGRHRPPLESERQKAIRIRQPASERRRQPCLVHGISPSSQPVLRTSLVRTSRTAASQRRQPKRW